MVLVGSGRPAFSPSVRRRRLRTDDDVELAVVEAGDPRDRGLLLVHGFGGAKEDFADHVDALAELGHHVVTFDHRGHGESDQPPDPSAYTLERLALDVRAVAQGMGLRDRCVLGHSMGGMVVRQAVLEWPELAAAVVFMDTSPGAPPSVDPEVAKLGAALALADGMAALRRAQDGLNLLGSAAYQRVFAERPGFPEYAAAKWASLSAVMWATLAVAITTQADQREALAGLHVPTLVLVGEQDLGFLQPSRELASAVPGAQLVVIPDGGHSPQFENPVAWRAALTDFLESLPA
ncbi:MAG: alpha/beta hydrolase [Acidimicrobiia bacterium]